MKNRAFAITYDYRCPFARILHGHLVLGLRAGAPWEVEFLPFTLTQGHLEPGDADCWDDESKAPDLLALEISIAAAELFPDSFLDLHHELFEFRHGKYGDLRNADLLYGLAEVCGMDVEVLKDHLASGSPRAQIAKQWRHLANDLEVFGVPTFVIGDDAIFVRLLDPATDAQASIALIEGLLAQMIDQPTINEFKHTRLPY